MIPDLNDLYFFVQVVDHGGFAPAARALNQPKSKLSRRVALLEERLGVRLIQRSTAVSTLPISARPITPTARPCWSRPMPRKR